jgi:nucleotide-binding universal stress UspA family protein
MKPIIALTDFSPISLNAAKYAADMARSLNSGLSLLHIVLLPMTFSEVPYPPESMTELMKGAEQRMLELKNELVERTAGKIKIETAISTGSILTETENHCKAKEPYAVIMGTQGTSAMERVFLGSNTVGLIKHLSWPLFIIPPKAKFNGISKIGFACDLKKVDETIPFPELRSMVKEFNAELHVLHAGSEREGSYTAETAAESRSLQNSLQDLKPTFHFLTDGKPENVISEFAEKNKLDLLIVVPKRHNIIELLVHKRHSKKLVLQTQVPIVAIHE